MPDCDPNVHEALAGEAERLASLLLHQGALRNWQIVSLHYAALHHVERGVLAPCDVHSRSHGDREAWLTMLHDETRLAWLLELRDILVDMKSKSGLARYEEDPAAWTDADVARQRKLFDDAMELIRSGT